MIDIFYECTLMVYEASTWFMQMLDALGFKGIYFGYVFVAMATGFLLRRFGSSLHLGSDRANYTKRKED